MANFKRHKSKRIVRCTLCTTFRWLGNGKDRFDVKTSREKSAADRMIRDFVRIVGGSD